MNEKEILYKNWKTLINLPSAKLKSFMDSEDGKEAGLSKKEAGDMDISRGRDSARAILRMRENGGSLRSALKNWTSNDWEWAKKQVSFVSRMRANKGKHYDEKGNRTRLLTSLLIWGHDPKKYKRTWSESEGGQGGLIVSANLSTQEPGVRSFPIVKKVKNKTKKFSQYFSELIPRVI